MHLREARESGKMTERFAQEYCEYGGVYIKERGKCQNPNCGHYPIIERHIVRNPKSGDVKEIGSYCYQRWRQLQGLAVAPWFWEYMEALRIQALSRPGTVITPEELPEIDRRVKRKWIIKKKGPLIRVDYPLHTFSNKEEADEFAEKHDGYCDGIITMRNEKVWTMYFPIGTSIEDIKKKGISMEWPIKE